MSDYYWVAIGDSSSLPFSGYYNGGGYTISNMYVTNTYSNYGGLFGYWNFTISNPTYASYIKNITLESPYINTSSSRYVGAVVCEAISFSFSAGATVSSLNISDITVNNGYVRNTGTFSNSDGGYTGTGGIVGYTNICTSKTIQNCSFEGTVRGTACAGGILGQVDRRGALTISNCTVSGDITASTTIAGGIVGGAELENGGTDSITISFCSNYAEIKGNNCSGGIIGTSIFTITISYCENYGTIDSYSGYAGGIACYLNDDGSVSHCENYGQVDGTSDVGGIVGHNSGMDISYCVNKGNVTNTGTYTGGIVGYNYGSNIYQNYNTGKIQGTSRVGGISGYQTTSGCLNCYNLGAVEGTGSYVGGIVGYNTASSGVVINYNIGNVSGTSNVGGITGRQYSGGLYSSFNIGNVYGTGSYIGGVAGYAGSSASFGNNYYGGSCGKIGGVNGSDTGSTYVSGIISNAKSLSWFTTTSNWNSSYTWDMDSIWALDSEVNDGYPYLRGVEESSNLSGYWYDHYDNSFSGSGTESDPYLIQTEEELAGLAYNVNNGTNYSGVYFLQTADLDMSMYWWDAIGTYTSSSDYNEFAGHYDGDGHTVSGIRTKEGITSEFSFQGIFGYVRGTSSTNRAEISNVGVIDSNIQGYQYVGGIAGYAYYTNITNCYNTGSVTSSGGYVGGVVGYNSSSTVSNSYNTGNVTSTYTGTYVYLGGVVGYNTSSSTVSNSYNTGSVIGSSNYVGGVVGYNLGSSTVSNSYNTGSVTGSTWVGGVVGSNYSSSSTVSNSYNTGTVTGNLYVGGVVGQNYNGADVYNSFNTGSVTGNSYVGGVVGYNSSSSTATNSYNTGTVTGNSYVGGVVGYNLSSSTVSNSYNTGDVTSTYTGTYGYVGGVVGYNSLSTVSNSYNTGDVTASSQRVGGVVGHNNGSSARINNTYNTGSVSGTNEYVGGVVGYNYNGADVYNSFNTGSVTGTGSFVGAIVGRNYSGSPTVYNCYWGVNCTQTLAHGSNGGTVSKCSRFSSDSDPKTESWYTTTSNWYSSYLWDFDTVWALDNSINDGYPYLQGVGNLGPNNPNYLWTDDGVTRDTDFEGGGTESDPYLISSAEELAGLAYNVNNGTNYSRVYFLQTADLDMSMYWWDAIGVYTGYGNYNEFAGHYDGNGHTVSGVFTQAGSTDAYSFQGLFGYVRGASSTNRAEVSNVGVINSNIQGYYYVGGVVGSNFSSTVENSYNTGSVTGSSTYVGGVAGISTQNSTIINSYNSGDVSSSYTGSYSYVGGIAGSNSYSSEIRNTYNLGNISGTDFVGGIAGENYNNSSIESSYNEGDITGSSSNGIGGIVGSNASNTIVENCYNEGDVITSVNNVGGVVGINDTSATVRNCYNTGYIKGNDTVGGVVGNNRYSSIVTSCYNTGSIETNITAGGVVGHNNEDATVSDSYNAGFVNGIDSNVGGVVGANNNALIYNCYNKGGVFCQNGNVGGVVGDNFNSGTIYNIFNVGPVDGNGSVGGVLGSNSSGSLSYCYWGVNCTQTSAYGSNAGTVSNNSRFSSNSTPKTESWYTTTSNWNSSYPWDFKLIWSIDSSQNDGYPILSMKILYEITLDPNGGEGGTSLINLDFSKGWLDTNFDSISSIDVPTRTGYTFDGYYTQAVGGIQIVDMYGNLLKTDEVLTFTNDNTTIYAHWVANRYNNIYYYMNSQGDTTSNTQKRIYEERFITLSSSSLSYYSNYGWELYGWLYNDSTGTDITFGPGESVYQTSYNTSTSTLYWYAVSSRTISISYDGNGGIYSGDSTTATQYWNQYGNVLNISSLNITSIVPTRFGYTFRGWSTDPNWSDENNSSVLYNSGDSISFLYNSNNSYTLYAIWEPNIYKVTLITQSSDETINLYLKYETGWFTNENCSDSYATTSIAVPKYPGYTFYGYYTLENGLGLQIIASNGEILQNTLSFTTEDTNLYAYWEATNPAYYDEEKGYWYVEMGMFPQDRVTDSEIISELDNLRLAGEATDHTYKIGEYTLNSYIYNEEEYAYLSLNDTYYYYKVLPVRYVLAGSYEEGFGTESANVTAITEKIVFASLFDNTGLSLGEGFRDSELYTNSNSLVTSTMIDTELLTTREFTVEKYMNINNGNLETNTEEILSANYTVPNVAEIAEVFGSDYEAEFSDLVSDILGRSKMYWTRDLGSNTNVGESITRFGSVTQTDMDKLLGFRVTIALANFACV